MSIYKESKKFLLMIILVLYACGGDSGTGTDDSIYIDNGNGTVTDTNTGLIWQKCGKGQNIKTCQGGYITMTWDSAKLYCSGLELAGKIWELPPVDDLSGLVDISYVPVINSKFFPNTKNALYWTGTGTWNYEFGSCIATAVDFQWGEVANNLSCSSGQSFYVRCVSRR